MNMSRRSFLAAAAAAGGAAAVGVTPTAAQAAAYPYLSAATWFWNPIPAGAAVHARNNEWAPLFRGGTHSISIWDYGKTIVPPRNITASTPRFDIRMTAGWGDPFPGTIPVPTGVRVPPMTTTYGDPGDGHYAAMDPTTGKIYSLWQAKPGTNPREASYGGIADLQGNGQETAGSSTATCITLPAVTILVEEVQAAIAAGTGLGHAVGFSSKWAGPGFKFPAKKSDGPYASGPPQGTRFRLRPTASLSGLSGFSLVLAKTLQTHGMYMTDKGGASVAFGGDVNNSKWNALGVYDYSNVLNATLWNQIDVLA